MNIQLIQGEFSVNEALELITQMIHIKIKYHENKIAQHSSEEDIKSRETKSKDYKKNYLISEIILTKNTATLSLMQLFISKIKTTKTMKQSENLRLIEGTFTYDEANEIIKNIFNAKIQFHELKNFSSKERLGKEDELAKKKINQLKIELEKFKNMLKVKENSLNKVVVSSTINISFENQ